ncbi:MAG: hypothetical protein M0036_14135 [Desulfobacteraceae bacterium]|nr:hypothetical protein [Desulfobacteraceae bacterium]
MRHTIGRLANAAIGQIVELPSRFQAIVHQPLGLVSQPVTRGCVRYRRPILEAGAHASGLCRQMGKRDR